MAIETKDGLIKIITYVGVVKDGKVLLVQYENAPNPDKKGWWVPGPELDYGEHPEERAKKVLEEFKLSATSLKLMDVESFIANKSWHVMFYYRAETNDDLKDVTTIKQHGWFDKNNMPDADQMAHGKWEQNLALSFLGD